MLTSSLSFNATTATVRSSPVRRFSEKSIAWARHPGLMKRMKGPQVPSHPAKKPVAQALAPQSSK